MNWRPIETYDELAKKPERAVFYFKAEPAKRTQQKSSGLRATFEMTRTFGFRVCTHWIELPPPPMDLKA